VTLVNPETGNTQTISLPSDLTPAFITATATTNQILVSLQPLSASTTCAGTGAIGVISTTTATLDYTICAGSKPGFIQVMQNDSEAFILDQTDNSVSALNLTALTPSSTASVVGAVGATPIWATTSLDGNTLYVLNQGSSNISVVDAVAETVNTTPITTGTLVTPSVIITDSSLNRLYVSNTGNNTVSILDASSSALPALNIVTVGTAPVSLAVTPDGASVYVANTGSNFASVINANSFNTT
jgi:YVTN family beta-propeller protein